MKPKFDIYACDPQDESRFAIGTRGAPMLFVIGLNPSTANLEKSDTTITKTAAFARRNGFPGFVMLNLYPLRVTDPDNLPLRANRKLALENVRFIDEMAAQNPNPTIWAAWGDIIEKRPYFLGFLKNIQAALSRHRPNWIHFGPLTKRGHPRHPSRLAYGAPRHNLDISAYEQSLIKSS